MFHALDPTHSPMTMPHLPAVWSPTPVRGEVTALAGQGIHAAAALQSGEVLISADGGLGWEVAAPLPGGPAVTALLLLPEAVLAGTAGRGLLRGDAAGGWDAARTGLLPGRTVLALAQHGGIVLAGTLRSGVFRSTDGGRSWHAASAGLPFLGDGLEVSQLVATRRAWYALHPLGVSESRDGGLRWRLAVAGLPAQRRPSVLAVADDALYAEVGARLYRLDPSARWRTGGGAEPVRLVGHAGDALFAVLPDGRTLGCSTDAGRVWSDVQRGLPASGLVTAVGATRRAVLATLDGDGVWSRPVQAKPDAPAGAGHVQSAEATLQANEPNPFSHTTSIPFTISAETEVVLTVHDMQEAEVARLAEGRFPAGGHRVVFEAAALPAGLYHCRLLAGGRSYDRPMLLLRP